MTEIEAANNAGDDHLAHDYVEAHQGHAIAKPKGVYEGANPMTGVTIPKGAGSPQFTNISLDDFQVIRDNLAGISRTKRDRMIPSCLFTDPQVAHIGLSENRSRQGIAVRVLKLPMAAVLIR